jgi:hypothetical protein
MQYHNPDQLDDKMYLLDHQHQMLLDRTDEAGWVSLGLPTGMVGFSGVSAINAVTDSLPTSR